MKSELHINNLYRSCRQVEVCLFVFNLFIYLFIFWLHWVFVAVRRLLIAVASLCCGAQALGMRASVVAAHRLSSCGSWALERRLSSCGARA